MNMANIKAPADRRVFSVRLPLTKSEYRVLEAAARKALLPVSTWVRVAALKAAKKETRHG